MVSVEFESFIREYPILLTLLYSSLTDIYFFVFVSSFNFQQKIYSFRMYSEVKSIDNNQMTLVLITCLPRTIIQ